MINVMAITIKYLSKKNTDVNLISIQMHIWRFVAASNGQGIQALTVTYSNTELSFWSPQMRISVMVRMVSTSRFRLWSVTVVFLVRIWYMYLIFLKRCKWKE